MAPGLEIITCSPTAAEQSELIQETQEIKLITTKEVSKEIKENINPKKDHESSRI